MREELTVASAGDMLALGRRLAAVLLPGDLVVLSGDLGAGKTTLVQGIGAGLGVRGPITSPTFVIARVHPSLTGGPALVHADAYRLASPAVISFLGEMVSATPIEVVARFGQALLLCDKRDSLATIGRAPATVMVAEKDRLISPRLGIELAMDIPGSHLIWVPGAGHALILERPGLVNEAITGLLAQVEAGGNLPRSA